MLPAFMREEAFIRLSKIAGCTVVMPERQRERMLEKERSIGGCTVLLSMHFKKKNPACIVLMPELLKERMLRLLGGFSACTVLVPGFFKENAANTAPVTNPLNEEPVHNSPSAPKEAAILPININPVNPPVTPGIPAREPAIIPLSSRTVRYPRFLNRHKTIHAIS